MNIACNNQIVVLGQVSALTLGFPCGNKHEKNIIIGLIYDFNYPIFE